LNGSVKFSAGPVKAKSGLYGRDRRRLGVAYVGSIVLAASYLLSSGLVTNWFGSIDANFRIYLQNMLLFFCTFATLSLPLDLIGFSIEKKYARTDVSAGTYAKQLIPAIIAHTIMYVAIAAVSSLVAQKYGIPGLMLFLVLLCTAALSLQNRAVNIYTHVTYTQPGSDLLRMRPVGEEYQAGLIVADTNDNGFTGGIVGLPGWEYIVIPKLWLSSLSPYELRAELLRRYAIIASGGRNRGIALALVFTLAGILLAILVTSQLYRLPLYSSAGQITMSLCYTIWSFIGLLVLPYSARLGVYEADRLAIENGTEADSMHSLFEKINSYLEDEPDRPQIVETIFHPVPTVQNRTQRLSSPTTSVGAWNSVRYAIAISPLGLGLLNRAVHCNAGRPALWAMPPAD